MSYQPRTNYKGPAIERIEADRVITATGCWESTFTPSLTYPIISHEGQYVFVHRYMYEHTNGAIPDGLFVLHHCDNPRCHNPEHLYLGTLTKNMEDCVNRGRHGKKYSFETLSAIFGLREHGMNGREIADHLRISHSGVTNILKQHGFSYPRGRFTRNRNHIM